jgi:hypothetical protein
MVQAGLGKKWDPPFQIIKAKIAGGVAWAVEHLLSKRKALSSTPAPTPAPQKTYTHSKVVACLVQHKQKGNILVSESTNQRLMIPGLIGTSRISQTFKSTCETPGLGQVGKNPVLHMEAGAGRSSPH